MLRSILLWRNPQFFAEDIELICSLARARDEVEIRAEIDHFHERVVPHLGKAKKLFKLRLSGERVLRLFRVLYFEQQNKSIGASQSEKSVTKQ